MPIPDTLALIESREQIQKTAARAIGRTHRNLSAARLVELALGRGEGLLAESGALVVRTGEKTGRSPDDKYVVESPTTRDEIWWGGINRRIGQDAFDTLYHKAIEHLRTRDRFVFDGFAGADPDHRLSLRVVTETAWHALFARTLFIRPTDDQTRSVPPQFQVIHVGSLPAGAASAGVRSDTFVGLDLVRGIVLILGTQYAGEIKKSIFSAMNYILPRKGVLSMHCSANLGPDNDAALFFGLSGTGKTTLSADPKRALIGDDETGWTDQGIFNIEGGCYAKCINLSVAAEAQIWNAIRFGSVLENVVCDPETRIPDYADASLTENTRATYPVEHIPDCRIPGVGPHPRNVILLTADAFGVLPPVARLDPDLAMFHFISGYTAKVAGTESGVTEPRATFSPCFGGPFLPLHPLRYATLFAEKLRRHNVACWLVNTGWTGGGYGVGQRMSISVSRAVIDAILSGALTHADFIPDPVFKMGVPRAVPGVPDPLLSPRRTWSDPEAYDRAARALAQRFRDNFSEYAPHCSKGVQAAAPVLAA